MKYIYSGCMQPDGSSEHLNCILLQSAKDSPLNAQKSGKENVVKQVDNRDQETEKCTQLTIEFLIC
mgnify:CR=1 FL=1